MTWALLHDGRIAARGSYAEILDTGEAWQVIARAWHPDGTELAPRLERGWTVAPAAMVARCVRRAA